MHMDPAIGDLAPGSSRPLKQGPPPGSLASLCFHYHYKSMIVDKLFVSVLKHVTGNVISFLDWNNVCVVSEELMIDSLESSWLSTRTAPILIRYLAE